MERKQSIALFGIVIVAAVVVGVLSLNSTPSAGLSANMIDDQSHMLGHVVLTALDPKGNIIAYRQTDNQIVNTGDDCASKGLFGTAGSCSAQSTNNFKYIAIGTSSASVSASNTNLAAEQTTSLTTNRITTVPTITNAASGAGSTVSETATFVTTGALSIQEAGIFDTSTSSTGDLFARQGFTPISLLSGDTLGITWTINVK